MNNEERRQAFEDLGLDNPTNLEDISHQLDSIENELLTLNENADGRNLKGIETTLIFIFLVLLYIAIK